MKRLTLFSGFFLFLLIAEAQTEKRENPIIYAETFTGIAQGGGGGFSTGAGLNYQFGKSLVSLRLAANIKLGYGTVMFGPMIAFPIIQKESYLEEISALYGWRFIKKGEAVSFSLGISRNSLIEWHSDENNKRFKSESSYIGIPVEANVKWFKAERKRFRIYGLAPSVSQPLSAVASDLKFLAISPEKATRGLALPTV